MKLLGWMHRKFRQNGGDAYKNFASAGGTCHSLSSRLSLDDHQQQQHKNHYGPKPQRGLRRPSKQEEELFAQEELLETGSGPFLFGGFLSIGTLGSAPINEEEEEEEEEEVQPLEPGYEEERFAGATTLTFGPVLEAIAEKQAEATTMEDLIVVSNELEKMLAAEAEKEPAAARISSARPSHASAKALGAAAGCPLQGYLFGSPIEVAETAERSARKERRASLGELFMWSRAAEEEGGKREEMIEREEAREKASVGLLTVKKMLKRRGSLRGSRGADGAESKFQKILHIFHRKIHPEDTTEGKKSTKARHKKDSEHTSEGGNGTGCCGVNTLTAFKTTYRNKSIPSLKCHSVPLSISLNHSNSNGNREHWIKTDADYLVLEL